MARRVRASAWLCEAAFDFGICNGICASLSRRHICCREITLESGARNCPPRWQRCGGRWGGFSRPFRFARQSVDSMRVYRRYCCSGSTIYNWNTLLSLCGYIPHKLGTFGQKKARSTTGIYFSCSDGICLRALYAYHVLSVSSTAR